MQKIQIQNFGHIELAEIDITKIVVLIGEQASGKSTIAKLIYFFKSLKEDLFTFVHEEQQNYEYFLKNFSDKIREKFVFFFPFSSNLNNFSVKYFYSETNCIGFEKTLNERIAVSYQGFSTKENQEKIKTIIEKLHLKNKTTNIYEKNVFETEKLTGTKLLINFIETFFNDKSIPVYVPAGRNVTVTYSGQFNLLFFGELSKQFDKFFDNQKKETFSNIFSVDMFLMKKYIEEIEGIKDYFKNSNFKQIIDNNINNNNLEDAKIIIYANNIIENILKGEYENNSGVEKIYYDKKNNGFVQLHNASSGQQEVIRILQDLFIILLNNKNVFRVIEEPEAHLYPMAQKYIIDLISLIVNNTDSQIIITTHSSYILSVFNNLLYASKVSQLENSNITEITEIIPKFSLLNANEFRAYSLKNILKTQIDDVLPYCQSIFDMKTAMISQNFLDDISEELGEDFNQLYNIHKKSLK